MPRYINNTSVNVPIINGDGNSKILKPGESSDTLRYYDITDFDKVSDEPFINPIEEYYVETFTGAENRTIVLSSPDIAKIRIQKAEGSIDIYLQDITNTPPVLQAWTTGDYPVDIIIDGRAEQIVIDSTDATGLVQIMEIKDR